MEPSEVEIVTTWHNNHKCPGVLTYSDEDGWQCSLDMMCPLMQEVFRLEIIDNSENN